MGFAKNHMKKTKEGSLKFRSDFVLYYGFFKLDSKMYSVSLPDYCDEYIRKLTLLIFSFVNFRTDLDRIMRAIERSIERAIERARDH